MAESYWIMDGKNALKGVNGTLEELPDGRFVYHPDPDNPAVLSDEDIIYSLQHSREARRQFNLIYPSLLPEEQERLDTLIAENPRLTSRLVEDSQSFYDKAQTQAIRSAPVRTVGPRGGKGWVGGS